MDSRSWRGPKEDDDGGRRKRAGGGVKTKTQGEDCHFRVDNILPNQERNNYDISDLGEPQLNAANSDSQHSIPAEVEDIEDAYDNMHVTESNPRVGANLRMKGKDEVMRENFQEKIMGNNFSAKKSMSANSR